MTITTESFQKHLPSQQRFASVLDHYNACRYPTSKAAPDKLFSRTAKLAFECTSDDLVKDNDLVSTGVSFKELLTSLDSIYVHGVGTIPAETSPQAAGLSVESTHSSFFENNHYNKITNNDAAMSLIFLLGAAAMYFGLFRRLPWFSTLDNQLEDCLFEEQTNRIEVEATSRKKKGKTKANHAKRRASSVVGDSQSKPSSLKPKTAQNLLTAISVSNHVPLTNDVNQKNQSKQKKKIVSPCFETTKSTQATALKNLCEPAIKRATPRIAPVADVTNESCSKTKAFCFDSHKSIEGGSTLVKPSQLGPLGASAVFKSSPEGHMASSNRTVQSSVAVVELETHDDGVWMTATSRRWSRQNQKVENLTSSEAKGYSYNKPHYLEVNNDKKKIVRKNSQALKTRGIIHSQSNINSAENTKRLTNDISESNPTRVPLKSQPFTKITRNLGWCCVQESQSRRTSSACVNATIQKREASTDCEEVAVAKIKPSISLNYSMTNSNEAIEGRTNLEIFCTPCPESTQHTNTEGRCQDEAFLSTLCSPSLCDPHSTINNFITDSEVADVDKNLLPSKANKKPNPNSETINSDSISQDFCFATIAKGCETYQPSVKQEEDKDNVASLKQPQNEVEKRDGSTTDSSSITNQKTKTNTNVSTTVSNCQTARWCDIMDDDDTDDEELKREPGSFMPDIHSSNQSIPHNQDATTKNTSINEIYMKDNSTNLRSTSIMKRHSHNVCYKNNDKIENRKYSSSKQTDRKYSNSSWRTNEAKDNDKHNNKEFSIAQNQQQKAEQEISNSYNINKRSYKDRGSIQGNKIEIKDSMMMSQNIRKEQFEEKNKKNNIINHQTCFKDKKSSKNNIDSSSTFKNNFVDKNWRSSSCVR